MAKSIENLTELQLECLAHVAAHKTSKEIAIELGLSSHAIDARVKRVLSALDVSSRDEAARLYVQHVGKPYQPLICQSPDVDLQSIQPEATASAVDLNEAADGPIGYLNDSITSKSSRSPDWIIALPFRTSERPVNDLTTIARLTWIVIILLATIVSVTLLISIMEGLTRLI